MRTFRCPLWPLLVAGILTMASTPLRAEEIHYDSGNRRDPFVPLIGPGGLLSVQSAPVDFHVEGIIYDPPNGSLVLIDGEFYKEGDTVKNAAIVSIFEDRIILHQSDATKTLWLREEVLSAPNKIEGEKSHDESTPAPSPKQKE